MKMLSTNSKSRLQQLGQGMTEYIIIVALIAIAGIAAYSMFGKTMQGAVADVSSELSGSKSAGATAKTNAAKVQTEAANTAQGMGDYGDTNTHK
jgi:Flp pilus assembly pilin Flp